MLSSNEIDELETEAKEYLFELNGESATSAQIGEYVKNDFEFNFENESEILDKELDGKILCIATIGRWDGRHQAYKILGNNLKSILWSFGCEEYQLFYNGFNVCGNGYHHDGRNNVEFREIRTDRCVNRLLNIIYSGEVITRKLLNYYTKSLRPYVKEIYGW